MKQKQLALELTLMWAMAKWQAQLVASLQSNQCQDYQQQ
jgi:hypothetical protein